MKKWVLLICALMGNGVACPQGDDIQTLIEKNNAFKVICKINKIEVKTISEKERKLFNIKVDKKYIIHAQITVINLKDVGIKINLRDYFLSLDQQLSSQLYIDSFVDYLIREKIISPKESLKESVYWVFDHFISVADLARMKLVIKERSTKI